MKNYIVVLLFFVFTLQYGFTQENEGIVAFKLPFRNSLTLNRFAVNPTFSFVRSQNKYISISNKQELADFENAPLTNFASYSGRISENIGAGIGVFQQNYGVLTTFGGVLNFAYNVRLQRDSNLTFGLNIGAYNSGINEANVVVNFADPSLQNIPQNFILVANPALNYGTGFLDFGVTINNLVAYNLNASTLIEDNPEQSIQGHLMYTGYFKTRGFFNETKFTGLFKTEIQKNETIVSALAMLSVPKGIWAQVGYNSLYGASGGVGLNITSQIVAEYNYETSVGSLINFGPSHEISLAYRFKNNKRFEYSSGDEISGILSKNNRRKLKPRIIEPVVAATKTIDNNDQSENEQNKRLAEQQAQEAADEQARLLAEQQTQEAADEQARLLAEQQTQETADEQARLLAKQQVQEAEDEQARLLAGQEEEEEEEIENVNNAENQLILNPKDENGKKMLDITKQTETSKTLQNDLFTELNEIVAAKNNDLKDLKEENDLSEKGLPVNSSKPFKSITEENNKQRNINTQLDIVIKSRQEKINELITLNQSAINDDVKLFYNKEIARLTLEQNEAIDAKKELDIRLKAIEIEIEYERKRRIKRADFDNEGDRYAKDRATLNVLKTTTSNNPEALNVEDLDFGEKQSNNIQILKNVNNVDTAYYLILAVHNDLEKRDNFITKIVGSGEKNIDFFFDVNTSKYYIYINKYSNITEANSALKTKKGNKPYNTNMTIVKIEN